MSGMNWNRNRRHRGREVAFKLDKKPAPGGWTHMKRQPVTTYTPEQRAQWMAENGDRL